MAILHRLAALARYIWPLRVVLIRARCLCILPLLAFSGAMRAFLAGLFDPVSDLAFVAIAVTALFDAWAIAVVSRLVLAHGGDGLDLPKRGWKFFPIPLWIWLASSLMARPSRGDGRGVCVDHGGRAPARPDSVSRRLGSPWPRSRWGSGCGSADASIAWARHCDNRARRRRSSNDATWPSSACSSGRRRSRSGFIAPPAPGAAMCPSARPGHGLAFSLGMASLVSSSPPGS